jgi:hypothetical protein
MLSDRRLADAGRLGGRGEAVMHGDSMKGADLGEVHGGDAGLVDLDKNYSYLMILPSK